jgi:predicted RNA-binding protein Jag
MPGEVQNQNQVSGTTTKTSLVIDSSTKSTNPIDKNIEEQIIYWIEFLGGKISPISKINIKKEGEQFRFVIDFEDANEFSDNSFALLKATQHIIRALIHKSNPNDRTHFCIDINNEQRKKRESFIKSKILNVVESQLVVRGKTLIVTNLTSYERFLVHQLFIDVKNIETSSVGKEDGRKLMIFPTSETSLSGLEDSILVDVNKEFKNYLIELSKETEISPAE